MALFRAGVAEGGRPVCAPGHRGVGFGGGLVQFGGLAFHLVEGLFRKVVGAAELGFLLAAVAVVHVEKLADIFEREAEPLAAQDQFQARAVAVGVEARGAPAMRGEEFLRFVKADGWLLYTSDAGDDLPLV